jgi:hypothetical protein
MPVRSTSIGPQPIRRYESAQRPACSIQHCAKSKSRGHFGGNTAIASTSNNAPGRASCGTPIVVLAGGVALFTYLSRTSR